MYTSQHPDIISEALRLILAYRLWPETVRAGGPSLSSFSTEIFHATYEEDCFGGREDPGFLNDIMEHSPIIILTVVWERKQFASLFQHWDTELSFAVVS